MNPISWIDIIGLIVLPVAGYLLYKISDLQKDLEAHKLDVAKNCISKIDFTVALDKLEVNIEKMSLKLDTLVERRSQHRDGECP